MPTSDRDNWSQRFGNNTAAIRKKSESARNDPRHPKVFYDTCQSLGPLQTAVEATLPQWPRYDRSRYSQNDANNFGLLLKQSDDCVAIVKKVTQAPEGGKPEHYRSLQTLVLGMMGTFFDVSGYREGWGAEDSSIQILSDAMEELKKMNPPTAAGASGNTSSHSGFGSQFNAYGGVQNNNTGTGTINSGPIYGSAHFGAPSGHR